MRSRFAFLGVLAAVMLASGCGGAAEDPEAKIQVVRDFIGAGNDQRWEDAASYLADDVVFDTPTGRTEGLDEYLASAQSGGPGPIRHDMGDCSVTGNVVSCEAIAVFPDFEAAVILEVVVQGGKIQTFTPKER